MQHSLTPRDGQICQFSFHQFLISPVLNSCLHISRSVGDFFFQPSWKLSSFCEFLPNTHIFACSLMSHFCKMISPTVIPFRNLFSTTCGFFCAHFCAHHLADIATFGEVKFWRAAVFRFTYCVGMCQLNMFAFKCELNPCSVPPFLRAGCQRWDHRIHTGLGDRRLAKYQKREGNFKCCKILKDVTRHSQFCQGSQLCKCLDV